MAGGWITIQTLTLNCLWLTAEAVHVVTVDRSIRRNGRQKLADSLRIGVVGTSWWTETFHLAGIASHGKADLVAICGQNRAAAVADRHGQPRVFTDYRTMIASGLLDAVVVATPDDSHHGITMAALEAGPHVLCEKSLARSAEEARQMLNAAETAGLVHMVMLTWRWLGIFTYVKQLLASGYIGRCRDARFIMQGDCAMDPDYGWRFDPARGSGHPRRLRFAHDRSRSVVPGRRCAGQRAARHPRHPTGP
ncbi:MAG TPA: Gfo/Idh/MocA family oxidoreductase [Microlunatus sp.]